MALLISMSSLLTCQTTARSSHTYQHRLAYSQTVSARTPPISVAAHNEASGCGVEDQFGRWSGSAV